MLTFIVVLHNQMENMKLRSSNLIIKNDAQIIELGFGRRFHDLKYLEVGIFFMFLNSLST